MYQSMLFYSFDYKTDLNTHSISAKALAVAGVSKVDKNRDYHGIFPLRGKFLNVRDATPTKLTNNAEVKHLLRILNLKFDFDYTIDENWDTLRYV